MDNKAFSDALDYIETIRSRKSREKNEASKLSQDQKQFETTKELEREKLKELMNYHKAQLSNKNNLDPLKMELLKARIEAVKAGKNQKESPEDRMQREVDTVEKKEDVKEGSKLKTAARTLQGVREKGLKLKKLLEENPGLTGWRQGGLAMLNLSQSEALAKFDQTARRLQADMARYGSQRGGAQALKWAERAKPSNFRGNKYNMGMIDSILEDTDSEHENMASEYQSRLGKEFPIKAFGQKKGKMVKIRDNQTGQVHEMSEEEAQKLMAGGQ
jgi:hypothetical protein